MARDAVTVVEVAPGALVEETAGTTITPANGVVIDVGGDTSDLLVRVTNTATTPAHDLTIRAGVNPPAHREGLGDVVQEVDVASVVFVVEGARHVQADGKIHIDFETGFAGEVWAYRLTGV